MKNIVIYGAGGMGKEVAWLIENINSQSPTWNLLGFVDDNLIDLKNLFWGYPVLGDIDWIYKNKKKDIYVICSIGKSQTRGNIYEKIINETNLKLATLIDPLTTINPTVNIGKGSIICKNCVLTVDTSIGKGVIMNTGSSVGHDSIVGDYCTLLTNVMVAGEVRLGDFCELGAGSFVLQGRKVTSNTVLAPLSSALKDITESGTYLGNPARRMR